MVLDTLKDLDMKSETLNFIAWFQIDWNDSAFSWDTNTYPIDMILVNKKEVWRPVLAISNTLLPRDQFMKTDLPVSIFSDGNVRWFPGDSFVTTCHIDLNLYPFDVQTCEVNLTQWGYQYHHFHCNHTEFRSVNGNGEWDIIDVGYRYDVIQESDYKYWILTYTITLKRKWLFYAINLIFPMVLVSALTNVVFILPVDSGDKMSVSVTAFLTLAVFLTLIQDSLAKNSDTVCCLMLYLAVQMALGALAIVESAFVVTCHHRTAAENNGHSKLTQSFEPSADEEATGCQLLKKDHSPKEEGLGHPNRETSFSFLTTDNQTQSRQYSSK
ncbi:neuronal acetylcholine receptor subunit alpha-7-like [Babylonia areolata]|uniref:neuronal acetylcholine receptor subunit alpha-7-like n=1 Tax=Babylonia areolata TaxID=304850 RepID=UPI003FD42344